MASIYVQYNFFAISQPALVMYPIIGLGLGLAAEIIPADLRQHLISMTSGYDLPQHFINGLTVEEASIERPENPQRFDRWTDPDGVTWVWDQPRAADGTYGQDDPATEPVESALQWLPVDP